MKSPLCRAERGLSICDPVRFLSTSSSACTASLKLGDGSKDRYEDGSCSVGVVENRGYIGEALG